MKDQLDEIEEIPIANGTVLEKIYAWSKGRPLWQRVALRGILKGNIIENDDIEMLKAILKSEKNKDAEGKPITPLMKEDLPSNPDIYEAVKLRKLENITHVNNLATNQTLEFGENGITVIYGDNGSGKSGYTRILKNACRARHREKILTNILEPQFKDETPKAEISYATRSTGEKTLNWEYSDTPDNILSAVSVFDKECSSVHIKKKNEIAFRPFGLDIPDTLAEVSKRVEDSINAEITDLQKTRNSIFMNPPWSDSTTSGRFVKAITKDVDLEELEKITHFSESDEERLRFLTETLSKNIEKAIREEELKGKRLKRFLSDITNLTERISEDNIEKIIQQKRKVKEAKQAAELVAKTTLGGDLLPDIGGGVWKKMWEAAREYSIEVAYKQNSFPNTEAAAKCVLCQQELSVAAKINLQAFENYVKGDLEKKARLEENAYNQLVKNTVFDPIRFSDHVESLDDQLLQDANLLKLSKRYMASIRLRQIKINGLLNDINISLSGFAPSPFTAIEAQIRKHEDYAEELRESTGTKGIAILKAEKQELNDRKAIKEQKEAILDEISRVKTLSFLKDCLSETNTRSVTTLGNSIADDVITPKIRDQFQKEIIDFVGSRVRVEIQRSGGSHGSPRYQLSLLSSPGTDLSTVLSEGEQTCVGLAAFLAELATSSHRSSLVFDDPVSSLDHKWRHKVAERLVEEARERQVIVFTHDLIFLNDIEDAAEKISVEFTSLHLTRFPNLVGVVNDKLPWDGMKILARIDALEKDSRNLRDSRGTLTDDDYKSKARDFYSNLRASWERALEEVGLSHVIMRHRDYIDAKNISKISVLDHDMCEAWSRAFSKCCEYTNAHDGSRARNQSLPEPEKLIEDVEELAKWVNLIKETE